MIEASNIEIKGGAGPYEAAAIATVIHAALVQEEAARSRRPNGRRPPAWVRLGMARDIGDVPAPLPPDPGRNWPDE